MGVGKMIPHQVINDEVALIRTGRELDNDNAHEMVQTIMELQNSGYKFILLDFSDLVFFSSAGVGSILGTIEISRELGGDIIICNASDKIMHILEVLDLIDFFTIIKTVEDAKISYAGSV